MSYLLRGTYRGSQVVVKQWRKRDEHDDAGERELKEELKFHKKLQHDFIMPLEEHVYHTIEEPDSKVQVEYQVPGTKVLWLIFPYYKNGDLAALIDQLSMQRVFQRRENCSLRYIVETLHGIAKAMAYIKGRSRTRRAIHRDLKTENVFLGDDLRPRLGDFGCAKEFDRTTRRTVGRAYTTHIRAPEQVKTQHGDSTRYNHKVDIYAFGHCIYELVALDKRRFGESEDEHLGNLIDWSRWEKEFERLSAEIKDLGSSPTALVERAPLPFVEKVKLIKETLSIPDQSTIADALESACVAMGVSSKSADGRAIPLPEQADLLITSLGLEAAQPADSTQTRARMLEDSRQRSLREIANCKERCLPRRPDLPYHLEAERNDVTKMLLEVMDECFAFKCEMRPEFTDILARFEPFLSRSDPQAHLLWKPTEKVMFLLYTADYFTKCGGYFASDNEYRSCTQAFKQKLQAKDSLPLPWSFERLGLPAQLASELEKFSHHSHMGRPYDRGTPFDMLIALRNLHVHFYEMRRLDNYEPNRELRKEFDCRHLEYLLGDRMCSFCGSVVSCVLEIRPPKFSPPVGSEMVLAACGDGS